jgi:two-component system, chemotaxis family, CheB/CheR fusion protein
MEDEIDELSRSNTDLKNLMESIDISILFVDRDFCIQLYTSSMTDLFNLVPKDRGRPLTHITHRLRYDTLVDDLVFVLNKHEQIQRTVKSHDNRWYRMLIHPYRSLEDEVEGVVLTFLNITQLEEAEEILKKQKQQESLTSLGLYALERLDLPSIMHRATQQVCMILEADYALLYTVNQKNLSLHLSAYTGWTIEEEKLKEIEKNEKWDAGYALRSKEPVVVNDYKKEDRFRRSPLVKELDIECGCHVKIRGYNDVYGVMSIYSGDKSEFSQDDLNYVQIVTSLIGFSIERKKAKKKLQEANKELEESNKELKKEIKKSKQYQREILNASITERWHLGSYLHDNLGQILASVKIMLADIHQNLPESNKKIKESINTLSGVIDEGMSSIRDLTHDIIPVDIEEEGVDHAFRFLIRQTQKIYNVHCMLEIDESVSEVKNRKLV